MSPSICLWEAARDGATEKGETVGRQLFGGYVKGRVLDMFHLRFL